MSWLWNSTVGGGGKEMVSHLFSSLGGNLIPGEAHIQRYGNQKHGQEMLNWGKFKDKKNHEWMNY